MSTLIRYVRLVGQVYIPVLDVSHDRVELWAMGSMLVMLAFMPL